MSDAPVIFLSHITEEEPIATEVRGLIEQAFPHVEVFQSSDGGKSLPGGQIWIDRITARLEKCSVIVVICSAKSIRRPWINFECGAGWIRKIPVIPICHSGISRDDLPLPLQLLSAADATNSRHLTDVLFGGIASGLGTRRPSIDFDNFIAFVKDYEFSSSIEVVVKDSFEALYSMFKRTKEKVIRQGYHESVTQLFNHSVLDEDIQQAYSILKLLREYNIADFNIDKTSEFNGMSNSRVYGSFLNGAKDDRVFKLLTQIIGDDEFPREIFLHQSIII